MTAAFVYAATRTPFGRFGGALADVRPDDLAATAITGVLAKAPDLDPERIGDVVWGNANGAGEDNRNVGRMAVLLAGLPISVPAVDGQPALRLVAGRGDGGSRTIESGDADVVLTGGVESMTRAPWVLPKPSRAFPAGNVTAVSTTLGWRLVNERMPAEWTVSLGEANEQLAERFGISPASGRTSSPPARTSSPTRPGTTASTTTWSCPVRGRGPDAGRGHPSRLHRREAGRPQAVVPHRRHHHRRQRLAAQRRRLGGAARLRGRRATRSASTRSPASPAAAPSRSSRRTSASRRSRRRTRRWPGPASAGPTSARSSSTRRSPCSRWPAWTPGRSTPTSSTPRVARSRSATRSAPPAAAILGTLAKRLRESGDRWGVAAICIGVGQGLAVVLENVGVTDDRRSSTTADEAVADIADGATVLIGGFGLAGMPVELIDALIRQGASDLTVVNNNAGNGDTGLAALLAKGRVRKVICSFPRQRDSWVFDELYRAGEIELEVVPQGNLAERMRAAGAGIGAFFCPDRRRHAAGRGQGDPRDRRPRLRAGVPDPRRRRADRRAPGRPGRQPRLPQDRPQLRAGDGHRRRRPTIAQVRERRRRSAASTPRPSSRRASTSTGWWRPDATPAVEDADRDEIAAARRRRHPARLVRQPRHRPAHQGRRPPRPPSPGSCCTPRTACSAWVRRPSPATRSTPT